MGLGVAAVAMMAASTAVAGYTTYRAGRIQSQTARYNAKLAKRMAEDARLRGEAKEAAHRQRISALVGRQRALIGASGIAVDEGSTLDIVADTFAIGELDALTIRNNAAREAWGQEALSTGFEFEEQAGKLQSTWGAGAQVVAGTAQVLGAAYDLKNP